MQNRKRWLARRAIAFLSAVALTATLMPTSPAAATNVSFRVGTLNIYSGLTQAQFVHDLELITSKADMVGLNEVGNRKAYLQDWAAANGWWLYAPDPKQAAADALLARKSMFDVISHGSIFECDTNGPDEVPPARYNNWVRYKHKQSGRSVYHINLHANAHIEHDGQPYNLPRTDCAEKQFADVKALANNKRDYGQVIVSGDLNVDFSADRAYGYSKFPWKVFEANQLPNLRSCYNLYGEKGTGTHGDRHIDYIYFWKRLEQYRKIWMTSYDLVTGTESDHNGVVAHFAIAL